MEGKIRQKLYFLVAVAFYFLALSMVLTGAVLPEWLNRFGVSPSEGGQLFFLYYLSYVVMTFLSGMLSDLLGEQWVLTLSQVFLLAGFAAVSLADHFSTIKWGMLLMGFGGGFCEAPLTGLVSKVFAGEEGYALNVSQISFGLGAASGPFLMGFFLSRGISWRLLYLVSSFVSLLLLIVFVSGKTLFAVSRDRTVKKDWLGLLDFRGLLLSSFLAIFLYVGAEIGSSAWMSTYLVLELKASVYVGGVAMAIFWGAITVGRLLFAQLSRFFASSLLLRFAVGIGLGFLVLLNVTRRIDLVLLALGGVGFGYSAIWPFIVANVASKVSHLQATAIGFTVAFGGMGALFFPWLMGVWIDSLNLRSIFVLVLVLVVALFA
ncbi:MAG: MFS transporter, partial [Candidatus Caldatribacteriaceae bacterium]